MADQIRINGNILSWGSIAVKIAGEFFYGFTSLSYGDKRERTYAYGMGRHQAPRAISRGKYTPDPIKLGGPKSTVQALRERLALFDAAGVNYGDVAFEIVASYFENDETPILVHATQCYITANSSSEEEGADPLKEEIEVMTMAIRRNGLSLFDQSQGATF
jgi:hypothetical protein